MMTDDTTSTPIGSLNSIEKRVEECRDLLSGIGASLLRGHKVDNADALKRIDGFIQDVAIRNEELQLSVSNMMKSRMQLQALINWDNPVAVNTK